MASSSSSGQSEFVTPTSGSDTGISLLLSDAFLWKDNTDRVPFGRPKEDLVPIPVLDLIDAVLNQTAMPTVNEFAAGLAKPLFDALTPEEVAIVGTNAEDIDMAKLAAFVSLWTRKALSFDTASILQKETTRVLCENLPDVILQHATKLMVLREMPTVVKQNSFYRYKALAASRELMVSENSPFSQGWVERFHQSNLQPQAGQRGVEIEQPDINHVPLLSQTPTPSRIQGQIDNKNGKADNNSVFRSAQSTTTQGLDCRLQGDRKRRAMNDADKCTKSFPKGPYLGMEDERGLAGFLRSVETRMARRGWSFGSPEHYYTLLNLVPDEVLDDGKDAADPETYEGVRQAVCAIIERLQHDYGGTLETERLLAEKIIRGEGERATSFISRLDSWVRRCNVANVKQNDSAIMKLYRDGIRDNACKEASYEYPADWPQFRHRAIVRCSRYDSENRLSPGIGTQSRGPTQRGPANAAQPLPHSQPPTTTPHREGNNREVCRKFLRGHCRRGDSCTYQHSKPPCNLWTTTGSCKFGDKCRYSHTELKGKTAASASPARSKAPEQSTIPAGHQLRAIVEAQEANGPNHAPSLDNSGDDVQMLWSVQEDFNAVKNAKVCGPTYTITFADPLEPPLVGLLDSGAVRNYISSDVVNARGWPVDRVSCSASLADGRSVPLEGTVKTTILIGGKPFEIYFYILPTSSPRSNGPLCIIGVRTMCRLKVSLLFGEPGGQRQVIVRTDPASASTIQTSSPTTPNDTLPGLQAVSSLPRDCQVPVEYLSSLGEDTLFHCSTDGPEDVLFAVDDVYVSHESLDGREAPMFSYPHPYERLDSRWRSVRAAPSYKVRLRQLNTDEHKDCTQQTHVAEVTWDMPPVQSRPPFDFSVDLHSRLGPEQRDAFRKEIQRFVSRGWWSPTTESAHEDGQELPTSVAFPVVQGPKIRPCVDVRRTNKSAPPSSYSGASCSVILAQVRLALASLSYKLQHQRQHQPQQLAIATLDANSAFYRVRLHGKKVPIRCLGAVFESRRLVFGLRCGPAVLEEILGSLIRTSVDDISDPNKYSLLAHWCYVDDITIVGQSSLVTQLKSNIIRIGLLWGFEFSPQKMHDIFVEVDGTCARFDQFRHLGVLFSYSPSTGAVQISLQCCPASKVPVQQMEDLTSLTKRSLFKLAGLAYDVLGLHPEPALAADLLRRISGRWNSGWDHPIAPDLTERVIIDKAKALIEGRTAHCSHALPFVHNSLEVFADASNTGMGFAVYSARSSNNGVVKESLTAIHKKAKIWRGPMVRWHINRKETYSVACAFLYLNDVIPFAQGWHINVYSDSRTAVSWLSGGSRNTCRSLEKVAVGRICDLVAELREIWQRRYGVTVSISHMAGQLNEEADRLSRLCSEWDIPHVVLDDGKSKASSPADSALQSLGGTEPTDLLTADILESQLHTICDNNSLASPPTSVAMAHGQPARKQLLQLQWSSPTCGVLFRLLKAKPPLGIQQYPSDDKLSSPSSIGDTKDYFLAEDGVLMKHVSTPKINGHTSRRCCYYVPVDTPLGRRFAEDLVKDYHLQAGCLNDRYIRWLISRTFSIPNLRSLSRTICNTCEKCQLASNRRSYKTTDSARCLDSGVQGCWQVVSCDLASMKLDRSRKFKAVLFVIDHYSRYVFVRALRDEKCASVVRGLSSIIDDIGTPMLLRSDGGPCFKGAAFTNFLSQLGIRHKLLSPYSPFSNGLVERSIASLKFLTRQLNSKRYWPTVLPRVVMRLNMKPLKYIDVSPYEIFFGRPSKLAPELRLDNCGISSSATATPDSEDLRRSQLDELQKAVDQAIQLREAETADAHSSNFKDPPAKGSLVLIFHPTLLGKGGHYNNTIYRVHDIVDNCILKLVDAKLRPNEVTPGKLLQVHYLNTRPFRRSTDSHSGGM